MPRTPWGVALILAATGSLAGCTSGTPAAQSVPSTLRVTGASTTTVGPTTPPTFRSAPTTSTTRPPFSADPTSVKIGDAVTYAGRGCPPKAQVDITSTAAGDLVQADPGADGSWSVTTVIPDASGIGAVTVSAWCQTNNDLLFSYKPMTVRISTYRSVIVTPAVARPGTTLDITGHGGCPVGSVYLALDSPAYLSPTVVGRSIDIGRSTDWHGQLQVPANATPGTYSLQVECTQPRSFYAFWPAFPVTVR